jgi:hypothetical protein
MNNQPRNEDGKCRRRINPVGCVLTIAAILATIYSVFLKPTPAQSDATACETNCTISAEVAAHMIVEQMSKAEWQINWDGVKSDPDAKVYHLTDAETYAKWVEYLDGKIEKLEMKVGDPKTILQYVCRTNGFPDGNCPRILFGMAQQESVFGKYMTGDGGKSEGWYHIMYYHNVPDSCSHDLECSADWTLKRMMRFGFGESAEATNIAIMKHNGTPFTPATKAYLAAVTAKSKLWDK